jgi:beta-glucosidase
MAVTNTGAVAGSETIQIYIRDEKSALPRPEKELAAFEKVFLEPEETKHITVPLDKYAVGYYDPGKSAWIAEEGSFRVLVGASATDIRYAFLT